MVLLRNNGDALPLAKGASVTLLGESAADLVYGGAGAGSVDTSTAPNLRQAMEAAGFTVNPVLWDFYTTGAGASYKGSAQHYRAGPLCSQRGPAERLHAG